VVAQGVIDINAIPDVDDRVAAQVRYLDRVRLIGTATFEPEHGIHAPVGAKIFMDLPIDGANSPLQLFIAHAAVSVIDDGNLHDLSPRTPAPNDVAIRENASAALPYLRTALSGGTGSANEEIFKNSHYLCEPQVTDPCILLQARDTSQYHRAEREVVMVAHDNQSLIVRCEELRRKRIALERAGLSNHMAV
jgi:hypothetical protein